MTQDIVHEDGRTDAERAYDALKSGAAYVKATAGICTSCAEPTALGAAYCDVCGMPVPPANPSPLLVNLIGWVDAHFDAEEQAGPWSGVIDIVTNRKPAANQDDQLISLLTDMYGSDDADKPERSPLFYELKAWIDAHFDAEAQQAKQPSTLLQAVADYIADEDAIADWIDRQRPAVLDWETARMQALAEWAGEINTRADGVQHRWPTLDEVEIGQTTDGTPVYGDFDNDDTPHVVWVEWEGFSICAGTVGFDMGDQEGDKDYHHITLAQWENLKKLVNSGVIDQALYFAKAWDAQREEEEDIDTIISILEAIDGGE